MVDGVTIAIEFMPENCNFLMIFWDRFYLPDDISGGDVHHERQHSSQTSLSTYGTQLWMVNKYINMYKAKNTLETKANWGQMRQFLFANCRRCSKGLGLSYSHLGLIYCCHSIRVRQVRICLSMCAERTHLPCGCVIHPSSFLFCLLVLNNRFQGVPHVVSRD